MNIGDIVLVRVAENKTDLTVRPGVVVEVQKDNALGVQVFGPNGGYHSHLKQSAGLKETLCWDVLGSKGAAPEPTPAPAPSNPPSTPPTEPAK